MAIAQSNSDEQKKKHLKDKIEQIRKQLLEAAIERKSLTDEKVILISQELDHHLLKFQLEKRK
ncbi:aspartyl-phosphate phosphatase Spo0E family protein [Paenibacillus alvei]|uniref:Aspartyl-phosphate phosphatase Spo0E family protein n=1 Tax=Paenibacillus alvei TaxID=44250 RepID=A0AAP7DLT7_PAEAL|nr:aspartyl-phosphate phosphatase Spo0E family protein [Paenibacillus alvei]NOJ74004.1 aspartyl-phosphate phosphatase Spo0E family protein [Paenibacillus alvei]